MPFVIGPKGSHVVSELGMHFGMVDAPILPELGHLQMLAEPGTKVWKIIMSRWVVGWRKAIEIMSGK